jgi:predicted RNA-binding Zn-ribbon protein involved in translation (DUF1610 family)
MSAEIRVGDLVYAFKGCPKCGNGYGKVFVVLSLRRTLAFSCPTCEQLVHGMGTAAIHKVVDGEHAGLPLRWVRKIQPFQELERERDEEEIEA